ncbi:hypothetical protein BH10BAC2_BH10BAC2_08550 [soil metagenome]
MFPSVSSSTKSIFENIYDKNSPLLFGIIIKLSLDRQVAENILIKTFQVFFENKSQFANDNLTFLCLLQISIDITLRHTTLTRQQIRQIILRDLNKKKRYP